MSIKPWHLAIAVLLAALAGCIGALAADRWIRANDEPTLHEFVHDELELTAEQSKQLETLEAAYVVEHKELELALRAANARLARAMDDEHEFGPEVAAAIDEVHARMGALQKATINHVFDMRKLLNPAQQQRFDRHVGTALTRDPRA